MPAVPTTTRAGVRDFTNMDSPTYEYCSLAPGHIRLLEISPDGMSHMKHVDLNDVANPKYLALSYTWGDDFETTRFPCDEQQIPVRRNLQQALLRLKLSIKIPIWMDAICIHQANEEKKMRQIKMMAQIYEYARTVLVGVLC